MTTFTTFASDCRCDIVCSALAGSRKSAHVVHYVLHRWLQVQGCSSVQTLGAACPPAPVHEP